jgi:hypothetical protein
MGKLKAWHLRWVIGLIAAGVVSGALAANY